MKQVRGLFASPNMSSVMSCVPKQRRGIGSALTATFFNVGFATSLNLAILIISLAVPYALVTQIISSTGPSSITQPDKMLFLNGLKTTYLWLAGLNATAIIPSMLRGKGTSKTVKQTIDKEVAVDL